MTLQSKRLECAFRFEGSTWRRDENKDKTKKKRMCLIRNINVIKNINCCVEIRKASKHIKGDLT